VFTTIQSKPAYWALWTALSAALFLQYFAFAKAVSRIWFTDPQFSYGVLIPAISVYLIWLRRAKFQQAAKSTWAPGFAIALLGCSLRVLASLSGTLVFSGIALTISLVGISGFLWGRQCMRILAVPLGFLVMMVPLPSYLLGQLSWTLQVIASTVSAKILGFIGVPVYQEGELLHLPNYVLEVEQACSGSRSIFALIAMALVLGLIMDQRWRVRVPLVLAAPVIAEGANIIRIVGTGLLAWGFGDVVANESLHMAWGVIVFVIAVLGLLAFERLLRWATNAYA